MRQQHPATGLIRHLGKTTGTAALVGVTALGLIAPAAQAAAPGPGAPGIGDAYFPTDGNGGYDVSAYDIHDDYTFTDHTIKGWTQISAKATADLSRFNLDFSLKVSKVVVNGAPATFTTSGAHELVITPAEPISKGKSMSVKVTYAGQLPQADFDGGGVYWDANEVLATNQPHVAAWWFPSNDHPADKAKVKMTIGVPTGKTVIANGTQTKKTTAGGVTRYSWSSEKPMATYLAYFAAGDFSVTKGTYQGLPWLNAVSKHLSSSAQQDSKALLATTPKVVAWLQQTIGAYPFETSGGLSTALNRGFALENQTRSTYDYWGGASNVSVVVHENAHQWFGDDIALHRWKDIWLNEGFASFMEVLYAEKVQHATTTTDWLLAQYDNTPASSSFWKTKPGDPGSDGIFSGAVYDRGAMTLAALRNLLGASTFGKVLRAYYAQEKDGNAVTSQFVKIAEKVSGRDLDRFFDVWLYTAKKPAKTAANGLGGSLSAADRGRAAALDASLTFATPQAFAKYHGGQR